MATITTDTFLDGGTARTAGETWTINGCKLTVRTDTRWHVGAPASMTGSLGTITFSASLPSKLMIDGRNVRWMPYNTGSGTVPAIGTTITQGGVSGYLLGVWASYTSAPTAVGAAMPATGYLKFREVAGGTFSAGALTGISANATSADVTGWIEVVVDQSANLASGGSYLSSIETVGSWFYLDDTSGSPHQVLTVPTNGGGINTMVPGVQIETAPGSGVFEWWPAITSGSWTTTGLATDSVRGKMVQSLATVSDGQVRIGGNGTSLIGYTPPAGCKVRVPNIFGRSCTTASRATNAIISFTARGRALGGFGSFKLRNLMTDWYLYPNAGDKADYADCCFDGSLTFQTTATSCDVSNCCIGQVSTEDRIPLSFTNHTCQATVSDVVMGFPRSGSYNITYTGNLKFENVKMLGCFAKTSPNQIGFTSCFNLEFDTTLLSNATLNFNSCNNVSVKNTDYFDRSDGPTTSSGSAIIFILGSCDNFVIDGLTFGSGIYQSTNPYNQILSLSYCRNITLRNAGTEGAPLLAHTNSSFDMGRIFSDSNTSNSIKIQRVYGKTRLGPLNPIQATGAYLCESVGLNASGGAPGLVGYDSVFRGIFCNPPAAGFKSSGVYAFDGFTSSTAGYLLFLASMPSETFSDYIDYSFGSASGFTGAGGVVLASVGDYITLETPYFVKGHSSFVNSAPTYAVSATNFTVTYCIDTGSGYGSFKTLNGANLSAETGLVTGFKMKLKVQCAVANASNQFQTVRLNTVTSLSDRTANLYPLDTNTLSFTGLVAGSEVRAYTGTDPATAVEIGGTESSGTSFSFTHSAGGSVGFIRVFALGYQPYNYDPYTYEADDVTLLVQQTVDRNYVNP